MAKCPGVPRREFEDALKKQIIDIKNDISRLEYLLNVAEKFKI